MNLYTEDIDRIKKVIGCLRPLADEPVSISITIFDEDSQAIGFVTNDSGDGPDLVFVPNNGGS